MNNNLDSTLDLNIDNEFSMVIAAAAYEYLCGEKRDLIVRPLLQSLPVTGWKMASLLEK